MSSKENLFPLWISRYSKKITDKSKNKWIERAHLKKHPNKKRNFQHPTVGGQNRVPATKPTK